LLVPQARFARAALCPLKAGVSVEGLGKHSFPSDPLPGEPGGEPHKR
jgi:hypothetical protein